MIQNDRWICEKAVVNGMITPFEPDLISRLSIGSDLEKNEVYRRVISYGRSSYGYDLRLSPKDFRIFRHIPGKVIDPKNFNPENLEPVKLHSTVAGDFFILPAHSYGLGVALERLAVPDNVTVICIGKSTYARAGLIANCTPAESGWVGHLTLEFSNSSSADCRIYANEGVVQLLFFEGEPCAMTYEDRNGKYQNQPESVVMARV